MFTGFEQYKFNKDSKKNMFEQYSYSYFFFILVRATVKV